MTRFHHHVPPLPCLVLFLHLFLSPLFFIPPCLRFSDSPRPRSSTPFSHFESESPLPQPKKLRHTARGGRGRGRASSLAGDTHVLVLHHAEQLRLPQGSLGIHDVIKRVCNLLYRNVLPSAHILCRTAGDEGLVPRSVGPEIIFNAAGPPRDHERGKSSLGDCIR